MATAAKKYQEGQTAVFVAPTGGVTIGIPVLIGNVVVIPMESKAQTLTFVGAIEGVFECDSDATVMAAGDQLSFKIADATFRKSSSYTELTGDLNQCAICMAAKGSATRVLVKLCPGTGNVV